MRQKKDKVTNMIEDPLLPQVVDYLNKFGFPIANLIQRKFKIGFSRAEKILDQIEVKRKRELTEKK